jgi:opacity protein-like surface antigen
MGAKDSEFFRPFHLRRIMRRMKQKCLHRSFHLARRFAPLSAIMRTAALGTAICSGAWAQAGDPNAAEVSTYAGVSTGTAGTHFAIGGSAGGSVYRYLIILVESGFSPLGNYTLASHQGLVSRSSGLYDFDLAAHVRIPIKRRWEPYGIAAPALLYNRFQKQVIQPNGVITYASGKSDVKFGFETGGGLRYYLHEDWGIRAEDRYIISTHNYNRFMIGVFRQF